MKKRLLTVLIAVCLVLALGTVTALADDAVVTDVDEFKTAVQTSGTITIGADMEFSTEDIVTIPQGVTIVLDMQGHSITVDSNFTGRPIINNGTLTVTGNGTIDSSASKYGGYGAINNFGTLTIENGTYIGNINADGAAIYNRAGGELTINDGYFTGTAAINSAGRLTINDGSFWTDSCNQYKDENGKTHWAYCVISSGELYFYNGSVTGVQGALAINNGYAEVYDGDFQTVGCEHGTNGEYSFYALYIAGEEGEVEAHIYGGVYTAAYRVALLCGNDNTGGDGGINARATANIHGGTFVGGNNAKSAMSAGTNTGDPTITGGTFTYKDTDGVKYSSDVSKYLADGAALIQNTDTGEVIVDESKTAIARVDGIGFINLASAIAAADDGDTVEIINDCTLESSVAIRENITIEGGNHTVTANGAAFYIQADLESFTVQNLTLKGAEYSGTYGEGNDATSGPWMGIGTYNRGYGVTDLTLINVTIDGFSYGLYFGGSTTNTNPVSVDADNLVIQNCAIKGAYFEKLTDSEFTDCKILDNGVDSTKVDSNFTSWMCGVDINLKYGSYENIVFDGCTFEGNGANNGTALHVKARDDGNYSGDNSASLTGVTVTGCTFEDNNGTNDIILGEPDADNKTPVDVNIQPDVPFTNNLAENATFTVEFKGDYTDDLPVRVVASGDEITLPTPTRSGYEFRGWRDGSGELHKAGDVVTVDSDMTFTAVWSAINIPDTYDIKIADAANGSVDTSLSNASAGSTITITATPDSGYSVASVTVTGPDGRVDVVRVNATTYTFKMPAGDVTVRVTFTDSDALPFTDVSAGQWFYDAVAYVYTNGMMEGDSATTFNPDGTMTRAMFWAVLGRIDGATITGTNWADQAREWAMAEGVSDGTDPNGLVTREQMVTMLWRYAGEPESSASLSAYTDAESVSDWAETAMRWAIDEGIITGMTDTTLVPQGTATRAQCATIFMRFDQM